MGLNFFYQPLSCKISGCEYVYVCVFMYLLVTAYACLMEIRSLSTLIPWGARPLIVTIVEESVI